MRKLGYWLGIAALALQLGWPLVAGALPRSVALVPLCTVDGVTHYLEVPTGKTPLEESSSHAGHCPLCFLGHAAALPVVFQAPKLLATAEAAAVVPERPAVWKPVRNMRGARAPPFSPSFAL